MQVSLFSQTTSLNKYPQKIVLNGDTVCAITIPQTKQVNLSFINMRFYKALSDSFRIINKQQNFIIRENDKLVNVYESQLKIKQSIIDNSNIEISNYKSLDKINVRKIKWITVQRNVLAVAVVVGAIKIFLIH